MFSDPKGTFQREYDVIKAWVREAPRGGDLDDKLLICARRSYGVVVSRAEVRQLGGPAAAAAWEHVSPYKGSYLSIYLRLSKVFDIPEEDALCAYHARLAELVL